MRSRPRPCRHRREIRTRLEVRGSFGTVFRCHRQGLLQGRRPERHHRFRAGLGRRDRARRSRHLSDRILRHQFAGQIPGPESDQEGPGGADGLRQAAVRHRHHHQDRHHQAQGPRRQSARRARARRRLRAVEGLREGKQHRRQQGEDREYRLPGARADACRRQGRRHHRLLVLDALQSSAEGPQA